MSLNHGIIYNGKLIEAKEFLGFNEKVYKVKYNGETLYNVLMDEHNTITVNNLICETLNPKDLVAKLYSHLHKLKPEEQNELIKEINKKLSRRKVTTNKKQIKMEIH